MSILKGAPETVNYLSFDGVDDWVEVNNVSINGGSLTVESWAKIISVDRTLPLFDSRDAGYIQARNTLSNLIFRFYESSGTTETSSVDISSYANSYHYYSYTYNASDNQFYFYVDGVELLNETINVTLPSNTINAVIGNQHLFLTDTPMQAEIKETRVWDVYRTPNEIQQNHSKYLTGNENGLIVYYDYTEGSGTTLVDKAGNNDGTIVGATWDSETVNPEIDNIYYGGAIVENHLSFDGVNDYVSIPTTGIPSGSSSYDISIKLDFNSFDSEPTMIYMANDGTANESLGLSYDPNTNQLNHFWWGNDLKFNYTLSTNTEYTIRTFYDGTTRSVYVNGSLVASDTPIGKNTNDNYFELGRRNPTNNQYLNGNIYDFRVFNSVQSQSTMENPLTGNESGLLVAYDFSEGSGTSLTDSAGTNDGTINGATWQSDTLYPTIDRVYAGSSLVYGEPVFTPSLLSPELWLDASDVSTITSSSGNVSQWNNKGSLGNFTQSTSANQPLTGNTQLNGLNVLDFNGDFLTAVDKDEWKFLHDGTKTEFFAVIKVGNNSDPDITTGIVGNNGTASASVGYEIRYDDRSQFGINNRLSHQIANGNSGLPSVLNASDNYLTPNQFNIISVYSDPNNSTNSDKSEIRTNNSSLLKNNTRNENLSTSNPTYSLTIGSSGNNTALLLGSVAEIIIISGSNATSQNRNDIINYLNKKWNVY